MSLSKNKQMINLHPDWMEMMEKDPFWVFEHVHPSVDQFQDIEQLLFWFDNGNLSLAQLEDALEEYEWHCSIIKSLMAARHSSLLLQET